MLLLHLIKPHLSTCPLVCTPQRHHHRRYVDSSITSCTGAFQLKIFSCPKHPMAVFLCSLHAGLNEDEIRVSQLSHARGLTWFKGVFYLYNCLRIIWVQDGQIGHCPWHAELCSQLRSNQHGKLMMELPSNSMGMTSCS